MPAKVTVTGVAQDIARLTNELQVIVAEIDSNTGAEILATSPVDTGFFRSNWNRSLGAPDGRVSGVRVPTNSYSHPGFGRGWSPSAGNIFYTNNVPYAIYLDAGSSQQAPQGITEPVAARIDTRFARVT